MQQQLNMPHIHGSLPVAITPFRADESLDLKSFRRQIRFLISNEVHGITILGFASEFYKLTEDEKKRLIEAATEEVNGALPLIVGVGSNATRISVELSRFAAHAGASAFLAPPPVHFFVKDATNIQLFYEALSEATNVPVIVQDAPVFLGTNIPIPLLDKMLENTTIRYLKIELAHPGPALNAYIEYFADRLPLIWGLDGIFFPEAYRRGCIGVMPGPGCPQITVKMFEMLEKGDFEGAENLYWAVSPLLSFSMTSLNQSQACHKFILKHRRLCDHEILRLPANSLDSIQKEQLLGLLRKVDALVPPRSIDPGDIPPS